MQLKYTKEQEEELEQGYTQFDTTDYDSRETFVEKFRLKHDKSKKSVVAKLSKMGVYITRPKTSAVTGGKPQTKEQILEKISLRLGAKPGELDGIDKSPKLALLNLLKILNKE